MQSIHHTNAIVGRGSQAHCTDHHQPEISRTTPNLSGWRHIITGCSIPDELTTGTGLKQHISLPYMGRIKNMPNVGLGVK